MSVEIARGHVFIATSIDGFVAKKDHSLDWLIKQPEDSENKSYDEFKATIDVLVMGSGSFKTILGFGFWPYEVPVKVMSTSMTQKDIPADLKGKVEIINQAPKAVMAALFQEGYKNAYIDGGRLVQSFINEGLIEDMTLTLIPILLGEGISLFGPIKEDIDLELIESIAHRTGFVQNHYRLIHNSNEK